ncbi:MAG: protein-methionine-sulfoxide reductase catalytic subunit MsrP [Rubrimonas sp.]
MRIIHRPGWRLPDSAATPESVYLNRRAIIAAMGFGAASVLAPTASRAMGPIPADWPGMVRTNPDFVDAGRTVTDERINARYNNFYEFGSHKQIYDAAQALQTEGWTVTIDGLVDNPVTISTDDLVARMPIEERVVRHRCVEAWSMVVPWIGFPLVELVRMAGPRASARYLRFETFLDPDTARGQRQHWYPWPYVEGITLDEATNDLAFMVVGAYGRILHKQFGAPIRLHLPWKYGFKSSKSVTRISFVEERPTSFWEALQPREYGFWANVNPAVAHPRWSQAQEQVLGSGEEIPTLLFNGYAEQVAHLYDGMEAKIGEALWR